MAGLYIRRERSDSAPTRAREFRGADAAPASTAAASSARKVYLETYGCQMNVADSDLMLGLLHRGGYARTEDPARPI